MVNIDGFDELFARDLWALNLDAELTFSAPRLRTNPHRHQSPTFDMSTLQAVALKELDWSTLHTHAFCNMPRP